MVRLLTILLLAVVVPGAPCGQVVGQTTHPHRFRFFIDPNLAAPLTDAELKSRLSQYIADINFIFAKQTTRRFTFDPDTDISLVTAPPHTGTTGFLPPHNFEVWA